MRETGIIRRAVLIIVAFVLAASYPYAAMAETQEETTPTSEVVVQEEPPVEEEPPLTYTYNEETQHWDSEKWQYNPETGVYEKPPAPAPLVVVEPEPQQQLVKDGEDPGVVEETEATVEKKVDTTVTLTNDIISDALSGNAGVIGNTTGGSATTGDAFAAATILNSVNSSISAGENQKVAQFTQDILGDVKGDIVLSPLLLKAMLEAKAPENAHTTIDATTNFDVNNNILLTATSGDATVAKNTTGGDATTGSATAVANVVNVLNSMIAAQQSFIGTINIYGDLEGDILIAPDFIPQMIANNAEPSGDSSLKVSSQDTQTIVNNIAAVAESGAADVFGNTTGGSATTGDALSNVVIFNLSGHEVIAKNSLLVFVNVLGKWVGVIVDAPEGATAAMLSNGVTSSNYAPDLTVTSESSHGITNTIAVNAKTGDATVAQNTTGGNAVSGSAKALANIANVTGSQFSASDWFGVLFINVFQNWYGSFGIDTPYGNIPMQPTPTAAPAGPIEFRPAAASVETTNVQYRLVDTRGVSVTRTVLAADPVSIADYTEVQQDTVRSVLSSEDAKLPEASQDYRLYIIAGSILLIGLSVIGLKRLFS